MKTAKASEEDLENMFKLTRLIMSACTTSPFANPYFPAEDGEEYRDFDCDNENDLIEFFDRVKKWSNGIHRVVWGYMVLLDNCVDPDADTLQFNERLTAALELYDKQQGGAK